MVPIPTISQVCTVRDAAVEMVDAHSPILVVVGTTGEMIGVVTEWDITRATAMGSPEDQPIDQIMNKNVISAAPDDSIQEVISKLEHHEISALPVVRNGNVVGMITADQLARRTLLRLLQSGN